MNDIWEINTYGIFQCPKCKSTNILIRGIELACIDCKKKEISQQGIIGLRVLKGPVMYNRSGVILKKEIKIYKPFGYLLKWLNIHLTWRKKYINGVWLDLIYTENFIPKQLLES